MSCTASLQSTHSIVHGRRRLRRRQGDEALLVPNQRCQAPSWRAHVRNVVCMLCRTGSARRLSAPTARSTPFQRRRHVRMPLLRISCSTSTSTRCPCAGTARIGGGSSSFRSTPRFAISFACIMDPPLAIGATIPPAIVWWCAVGRRGVRQCQHPLRLR